MEKTAFLFLSVVFGSLPNFLLGFGDIPDPQVIQKELYCIGCEYTVKALHGLMQLESSSDDNLDLKVTEALQSVCSEEYFSGSEIPSKELLKACEFLIEENGKIMDPLLVTHYSRKETGSYLDLSQQICMDLSKACVGIPGDKRYPDHLDSGLEYDAEAKVFRVKTGKDFRIPEPVRAKEDL